MGIQILPPHRNGASGSARSQSQPGSGGCCSTAPPGTQCQRVQREGLLWPSHTGATWRRWDTLMTPRAALATLGPWK